MLINYVFGFNLLLDCSENHSSQYLNTCSRVINTRNSTYLKLISSVTDRKGHWASRPIDRAGPKLSLTSDLDGGGWSKPSFGRFTAG
jgi:hypothetical protein